MTEFQNMFSVVWMIFSLSFLVALTGAMAPGPLLTYTIIKSVKTSQRGYLMGLWIIIGHALLEMCVIILLLYGFSLFLQNVIVVRIIGISGGILLIAFGGSIVRNVYRGNIPTDFMDEEMSSDEGELIKNPILGGFMVSMANPYWWIWWATIGFAFMLQFNISFQNWPKLIAFFLGHEAGDLIWYLIVSILSFWGIRRLNKKAYYGILYCCGLFMMLFGIYLGISPFFTAT